MLLGALIALQVTPGPRLMVDSPEIFWAVIMSMFIGNLVLLVLAIALVITPSIRARRAKRSGASDV